MSEFVKQNIFLLKYILENFLKLLYICLLINFNSFFFFKRYNKQPFIIFKSVVGEGGMIWWRTIWYFSTNSIHILNFNDPQIHNFTHPPYFLYIKNIRKIIQKFSKNYSTKDSKESFFDCMQSWLDQEKGRK